MDRGAPCLIMLPPYSQTLPSKRIVGYVIIVLEQESFSLAFWNIKKRRHISALDSVSVFARFLIDEWNH